MAVKSDRVNQLETMAVFALLCLLGGVIFERPAFLYAAIVTLLIALFIPPLARLITRGWGKLSRVIAAINSRILLTLLFFLVLAPLAYLYRLFNRDPLKLAKRSGSLYSDRNHIYTRDDLEKMW